MEGVMLHQYLAQSGGKEKILGGLDEFWNAFPQGISESTLLKEDLKWLSTCTFIYTHTHTCTQQYHTLLCPQALLNVCKAIEKRG